jgi:hypothetical protein
MKKINFSMPTIGIPSVTSLAILAVAGALVYVYFKGAKGTGQQLGAAAVDLVDGVISGGVIRIGENFGIPQTNMDACERAKAMGDTYTASKMCPAADFLKTNSSQCEQAKARGDTLEVSLRCSAGDFFNYLWD